MNKLLQDWKSGNQLCGNVKAFFVFVFFQSNFKCLKATIYFLTQSKNAFNLGQIRIHDLLIYRSSLLYRLNYEARREQVESVL